MEINNPIFSKPLLLFSSNHQLICKKNYIKAAIQIWINNSIFKLFTFWSTNFTFKNLLLKYFTTKIIYWEDTYESFWVVFWKCFDKSRDPFIEIIRNNRSKIQILECIFDTNNSILSKALLLFSSNHQLLCRELM